MDAFHPFFGFFSYSLSIWEKGNKRLKRVHTSIPMRCMIFPEPNLGENLARFRRDWSGRVPVRYGRVAMDASRSPSIPAMLMPVSAYVVWQYVPRALARGRSLDALRGLVVGDLLSLMIFAGVVTAAIFSTSTRRS